MLLALLQLKAYEASAFAVEPEWHYGRGECSLVFFLYSVCMMPRANLVEKFLV